MKSRMDLTEPELQVMQVVWHCDGVSAKDVIASLSETSCYSASTVYTLIYRCIKKGAIERRDPGFILVPLVSREEMQESETRKLADKLFDGSVDSLFTTLIDRHEISDETVRRLRNLIDAYERGSE